MFVMRKRKQEEGAREGLRQRSFLSPFFFFAVQTAKSISFLRKGGGGQACNVASGCKVAEEATRPVAHPREGRQLYGENEKVLTALKRVLHPRPPSGGFFKNKIK